uniref:Uncharacterized protein n=1 Tax=Lepeophtheirus salmonis TaxID=72036 RepID=A0A0K2SV77_LEPSM
MILNLVMKFK